MKCCQYFRFPGAETVFPVSSIPLHCKIKVFSCDFNYFQYLVLFQQIVAFSKEVQYICRLLFDLCSSQNRSFCTNADWKVNISRALWLIWRWIGQLCYVSAFERFVASFLVFYNVFLKSSTWELVINYSTVLLVTEFPSPNRRWNSTWQTMTVRGSCNTKH